MIDDRSHRKRPRGRAPLPDARALEIFVAVVDEGSFTAAARRLGMTQPGASRAVALLERDLGVALLDRGLRPIRPTGAGRVVHRHGQRLLAEMDALRAGLRRATRERLPSLRLGLIVSVTAAIAPLAKALQTIADDVRIWTALTPELAQGLRRRELDVLVTSDPMEDMPGVERRRVLTEPFVLVLPSTLAKTHAKLGLRELAQRLPFVRYTARSIIGRTIEAHLARNRVAAAQRLELDSSASVLAAVGAGMGWAISTPLCILQGRAEPADVAIRPLPGPALERGLYTVARAGEFANLAKRVEGLTGEALEAVLHSAFGDAHSWIMRQVATASRERGQPGAPR